MTKSADAFRTISEVSDLLATPTHVLRFWEGKFTQIRPVKRAGGRRYYRPSDIVLLGGIKRLLHEDGMTIRGVQKLLREHGIDHVMGLSEIAIGDIGNAAPPETAPVAPPVASEPRPAPSSPRSAPWTQGSLFDTADEAPIALDVELISDPLGRVVHLLHSGTAPSAAVERPSASAPRDPRIVAAGLQSMGTTTLAPFERLRLLALYDRARALRGRLASTAA